MTDKELQKLGRRELLQLLLDQAKETDRVSKLLKDTEEQLSQTEEGYERLRERLDHKDARIHELQEQINELHNSIKDEKEKRIADLSEVGSIAEAALKLNGVFDAAQRAANQYLRSVKELYAIPDGKEIPIEIEPEPEWGRQDDGAYAPEPPRSRTPEPGRYRVTDQPPRPRPYSPEEPDWGYQDDGAYAPEPPRSRTPEPGRYRVTDQPSRPRPYLPEEPEPDWGDQDDGAYAPEPSRSRPPEPGHYRITDQPTWSRQYPPEESEPQPDLESEGRAARQERERRTGKREAPSQSKMPFRVKKRKETGKTTLFFGWQHD